LISVLNTLERFFEQQVSSELTWHAYNSLESVLQSLNGIFTQLKGSRDQGSFQNFAATIDSLSYHLKMFGVPHLLSSDAQIERTAGLVSNELKLVAGARLEVEKLGVEVKTLIAPAVAGSLSESFTARKKILMIGRIIWGVIALIIGGYCIHATYGFAAEVINTFQLSQSPQPTQIVKTTSNDIVWLSVLIRSAILLPLYLAFGFSFSQYKKERDFEEEYAHKAAVATSLSNYGDLTREPAVRDQIVTGATNVIFSSPTSKYKESEKSDKVLGGIREMIDSLAKLLPKKD
jgi:hypothetical protein